jgi:hypothetical protein
MPLTEAEQSRVYSLLGLPPDEFDYEPPDDWQNDYVESP